MASKKKRIIIILASLSALLLAGGGAGFWFYYANANKSCLRKDESATYKIEKKNRGAADLEMSVDISIADSKTNIQKNSFKLDNLFYDAFPIEIHKCDVYAIKMFNYDYRSLKQPPGNRSELWQYDYYGNGKKIVLLDKTDQYGKFFNYYSYEFRVSPTEKHVALTRSYAGSPTHAFIIKNLKTLKDDFVLLVEDILKKYPSGAGASISLNLWSKDGKYFWGNLFDGADVLAFIRIETGTWKWDVFPAPAGTMGGDVLNPENGWVTYDDGIPWTGDADWTEEYIKEWKKEDKKIHFYIYNLITKEQILLATIDDPSWGFGKKWISDTELEYYLPGEVKEIYKIELK